MPYFLFSFWWLIFAVPLVPLIIHLINLLRHERVEWAAMEFLLKSYKKHSQHVWLMQLLLLLLRMLLAAVIVAMLAQLVTPAWSVLRGRTTHHYVLVDDSYSMSDRVAGDSAFDRAKAALARIGAWATQQDTPQKYTLVRFSQARAADGAALPADVDRETVVDLNAQVVDTQFDVTLEGKRNLFEVTQLAVSPLAALKLVGQLMRESPEENRVVYLVSDYRTSDWDQPAEIKAALSALKQQGSEIHLIDCVDAEHNNLGIVYLAPEERTRAAGVPLFVDIKVKNYGKEVARKVQIKFTSIYNPPSGAKTGDEAAAAQVDDLPPVFIEEIGPGETAVARTQVYFPTEGEHVVSAELPEDAVASDNRRWTVVDFPPGNPVLVVDGDLQRDNEYYLTTVFAPIVSGSDGDVRVRTGIMPEPKTAADIRDSSAETLAKYHAIYLLDVDRLDPRAVTKLEEYVRGGGGLAIFLGPTIDLKFYNQTLYAGGKGLLPLPLGPRDLLVPPENPGVPDFVVAEHPVFQAFFGEKNSNIRRIDINQYYTPARGWQSPDAPKNAGNGATKVSLEAPATEAGADVKVLATLHNRYPLVLEKRFGEGRVVTFLTSLAPLRPDASSPEWNNWARDPSFIVLILELQSYLAASRKTETPRLVGTPIALQVPADKYQPKVEFRLPPVGKEKTGATISREALRPKEDSPVLETALGAAAAGRTPRDTWQAGIYEAILTRSDNQIETRRFALNVDPVEGEMARVNSEQLKAKLPEIEFKYHAAQDLEGELTTASGSHWSEILFVLVILMLLGEQALAYACGYHPQAPVPGATR